jgi:hypothetical protein
MRTVPWPPGGTWALDVLQARLEIGAVMKRLLKASAWGCRQGPDYRQRSVTSVEGIRHVCLVVDLDRDHLDRDRVLARPARRPEATASSGTSSSACPSSRPRSSSLTSSTIAPGSHPSRRPSASARCGPQAPLTGPAWTTQPRRRCLQALCLALPLSGRSGCAGPSGSDNPSGGPWRSIARLR